MIHIGLDIEEAEFRSIRKEGGRLVGRKVAACYCTLDDKPTNRRLLGQAKIPFATAKDALIVIGDSALELSTLISCPVIPIMSEGKLPANDPVGRQVCVVLVEALVPESTAESAVCALSASSGGRSNDDAVALVAKILQLRGYEVTPLDAATAVCLAELRDFDFSGLSIVVRSEKISMSLTHLGKPVFREVFGQGFRSIEERFSRERHRYLWDSQGNRYLDTHAVDGWLHSHEISLSTPQTGDELWIAQQCAALMKSALDSMQTDLIRLGRQGHFRKRIPIVFSGRATEIDGFDSIVANALEESCVSLRVQQLSRAKTESYAVAKGLLVHAFLAAPKSNSIDLRVA